ncbi:MAG: type II secretion system protein J [Limnohabitans sp.]
MRAAKGFTLVEVLVAIGVMALLALMSWRGLDAMLRTQTQLQQRADRIRTLQAGLAQWQTDLNQVTAVPGTTDWSWDGRVLRLTRVNASPGEGLQVVAWTWRADTAAGGQWWRWQSAVLRTRSAWQEAWQNALVWSQTPTEDLRAGEIGIHPLAGWQLLVHRGGSWTNPLSSEAISGNANTAGTPSTPTAGATAMRLPDGVRMVLDLPAQSPLAGRISLDWVRPTLTGAGS